MVTIAQGKFSKPRPRRPEEPVRPVRKRVAADPIEKAEADIARRGRNAHAHHAAPKNQDAADYRAATALEALIGYLYLIGQEERLLTLFKHSQEDAKDAQE